VELCEHECLYREVRHLRPEKESPGLAPRLRVFPTVVKEGAKAVFTNVRLRVKGGYGKLCEGVCAYRDGVRALGKGGRVVLLHHLHEPCRQTQCVNP